MSNSAVNLTIDSVGGPGPFTFDLPVKASTHIYAGTLISQHSGGYYVPYSTSGGGCAIGVAKYEVDNAAGSDGDKRVLVETNRMFAFTNGTSGDAFSDTSVLGAPVYASDDHTVANNSATATRKCVGKFYGFETDGKVRVFVDPSYAYLIDQLNALQLLTDTPASVDALRDNIVASLAGLL